jgi:hypothetical protein
MKKIIDGINERTGIPVSFLVIYMIAIAVIIMDMMVWRPN